MRRRDRPLRRPHRRRSRPGQVKPRSPLATPGKTTGTSCQLNLEGVQIGALTLTLRRRRQRQRETTRVPLATRAVHSSRMLLRRAPRPRATRRASASDASIPFRTYQAEGQPSLSRVGRREKKERVGGRYTSGPDLSTRRQSRLRGVCNRFATIQRRGSDRRCIDDHVWSNGGSLEIEGAGDEILRPRYRFDVPVHSGCPDRQRHPG